MWIFRRTGDGRWQLWWSEQLRDTGFNPGQRDAIVSLTAAAIGFFVCVVPFPSFLDPARPLDVNLPGVG
jgi:hypothetical protein